MRYAYSIWVMRYRLWNRVFIKGLAMGARYGLRIWNHHGLQDII